MKAFLLRTFSKNTKIIQPTQSEEQNTEPNQNTMIIQRRFNLFKKTTTAAPDPPPPTPARKLSSTYLRNLKRLKKEEIQPLPVPTAPPTNINFSILGEEENKINYQLELEKIIYCRILLAEDEFVTDKHKKYIPMQKKYMTVENMTNEDKLLLDESQYTEKQKGVSIAAWRTILLDEIEKLVYDEEKFKVLIEPKLDIDEDIDLQRAIIYFRACYLIDQYFFSSGNNLNKWIGNKNAKFKYIAKQLRLLVAVVIILALKYEIDGINVFNFHDIPDVCWLLYISDDFLNNTPESVQIREFYVNNIALKETIMEKLEEEEEETDAALRKLLYESTNCTNSTTPEFIKSKIKFIDAYWENFFIRQEAKVLKVRRNCIHSQFITLIKDKELDILTTINYKLDSCTKFDVLQLYRNREFLLNKINSELFVDILTDKDLDVFAYLSSLTIQYPSTFTYPDDILVCAFLYFSRLQEYPNKEEPTRVKSINPNEITSHLANIHITLIYARTEKKILEDEIWTRNLRLLTLRPLYTIVNAIWEIQKIIILSATFRTDTHLKRFSGITVHPAIIDSLPLPTVENYVDTKLYYNIEKNNNCV
jgi:hypothetical protein